MAEKAKAGNSFAHSVLESWANAEWFTSREAVPESIKLVVFKVTGETNTDDLSPAPDAWSRPDIPLHALAMFKMTRDGLAPDQPGEIGPMAQIKALQEKGLPIAFVGDVVGTGSSRSGTNSAFFGTSTTAGVCRRSNTIPGALVFEASWPWGIFECVLTDPGEVLSEYISMF